jgi:hypothetical protein
MKTITAWGTAAFIVAAMGVLAYGKGQEPPRPSETVQPVSWDRWLAAKAKAEENDAAGNFVAALQYYLEYTRQAEGLASPVHVAWGKNNAAYMIIKMHRGDPTVDLAPAKRFLEEGLAVPEATEECRQIMARNLEYTRQFLRAPG